MASATALAGSSGAAFLLPPASPPQPRSLRASPSSAPPGDASQAAGLAAPWAAWGCLAAGAAAAAASSRSRRAARRCVVARAAAAGAKGEVVSRADLLRSLGSVGAASLVLPLVPDSADAVGLGDAEKTLTSYGLAELTPKEAPPFGWNICVEPIGLAPDAYYGRFNLGGEPQVVLFNVPPGWVITKPNIDYNGAAGTVQANDYGKGDTATFWVNTEFKGDLSTFKKKDFKAELTKALTTKGKGFIESLTIDKVMDGAPGYKIASYTYDVESAAGFTIARSGIAAFTAQSTTGDKLQILWTGVVTGRYKEMQEDLSRVVNSFRIGTVPKSISTSMIKEFKSMDEAMSAADIPRAQY